MERLVYKPQCGCEVYRIMGRKPNLYRIQYCSKHEAAEDMYEVLKEINAAKDSFNNVVIIQNMVNALRKAEGK